MAGQQRQRRTFNWQPYRTASAFIFAILSAVVAVLILVTSDKKPVDEWLSAKVRPTVLLAICTVVANVSIHFALSEGLPILWWLEAQNPAGASTGGSRSYASYERLDNIYNQGIGAWSALLGTLSLRPTRAGLACLAAIAVALNGPFLQRASRVDTEHYTTAVNITSQLATVPPYGFTGLKSGRFWEARALMPDFAQVVKRFSAREDITIKGAGCIGVCTTTVEAMGFGVNCSQGLYDYDMREAFEDADDGIRVNYEGGFGFFSDVNFRRPTDFGSVSDVPHAIIDVSTKHKNKKVKTGQGIWQNCTLTPSKVRYPIRFTNSTVVLQGNITDDEVLAPSNIIEDFSSTPGNTTFGGFVLSSQLRYRSGARIWFAGAVSYAIETNGSLGFEFAQMDRENAMSINTNMTWADPMPTILAGMRELIFRAAIDEGSRNSSLPVQISPASVSATRQIYISEYRFLAIAVATVVIGLLGVAPLFWGMWRLQGHDATLSPVRVVAKANAGELVIVGGEKAGYSGREMGPGLMGARGTQGGLAALPISTTTISSGATEPFLGQQHQQSSYNYDVPAWQQQQHSMQYGYHGTGGSGT